MALITAFKALRPQAQYAKQVASRPYDVLNSKEAKEEAAGNPFSFLHITKSEIDLPDDIENRNIVLIDDVLYTGRTIRAAIDQLIDFGRPRRVQLAVLIDRGKEHRELPIQADYIGKLVPTKKSEIIKVMLQEFDEEEGVVIVERPSETA